MTFGMLNLDLYPLASVKQQLISSDWISLELPVAQSQWFCFCQVFRLFDRLHFLVDGRTAYFGAVSKLESYFESIGYTMPDHTMPADFVMRLCLGRGDISVVWIFSDGEQQDPNSTNSTNSNNSVNSNNSINPLSLSLLSSLFSLLFSLSLSWTVNETEN